jgi:sugar porter (SP) family MFS transporter
MAFAPHLQRERSNLRFLVSIVFVATVGGLLFGYDTAVVSGAIGFLVDHFELTAAGKGWAASCALIGCIFGAMFAGILSDAIGRRRTLILSAILFTVSAIGSAIPRTLDQFVIARIIGGLGVGAASMLSPLYISEIAPARHRGRLVSLNQLAIVSGILVVYFVNLQIQKMGNVEWNTVLGWRWMFGSEALPALFFWGLLLMVPESPRWLVKQGRYDQAKDVLTRLSNEQQAQEELDQIKATVEEERSFIVHSFLSGFEKALLIGVVLAIFQQITGINAVLYYAPEIFKATGTGINAAFLQTVTVGAVNVLFTFVAILFVDHLGRRLLLITGTFIQMIALLFIGYSFHTNQLGVIVLAWILIYVAAFAMAMGPVVWVVIAEIFPTRIRGRAVSIATVALWIACYAVSQTFPMLVDRFGSAITFWLYAASCFVFLVFLLLMLPETRGKSLEEIEKSWQN